MRHTNGIKIFNFFRKKRDSLHLKLTGDFDDNSKHKLFNTLIRHGAIFYQILINTNCLKTINTNVCLNDSATKYWSDP
jgi:hypothetical protein